MSVAEERRRGNRMLTRWRIHRQQHRCVSVCWKCCTYHLGLTHTHTCFRSETKEVASISQDFKRRCLVGMVSGCVIWGWAVTANLRWVFFFVFHLSPESNKKRESKRPQRTKQVSPRPNIVTPMHNDRNEAASGGAQSKKQKTKTKQRKC